MDTVAVLARDPVTRRRVSPAMGGPLVAIVGAGFSGTMAAVHLRRSLGSGVTISLFDRTGRFARGPAYAESAAPHLLNVRAQNMSAFPDQPDHFDRWIEDQATRFPAVRAELVRTEAGNFATRRLYGRYLRQLLFRELAESGGRVRLVGTEITRIVSIGDGWRLTCTDGRDLVAAAVVLANGNLLPRVRDDGVVFRDPWADRAASGLRPNEPVLVVGTGLTMVDLALCMRDQGFTGPVIAMSRRGLVPRRHAASHAVWSTPIPSRSEANSLLALLRRVRREIALAEAAGIGWRAVIDSLRPITARLWHGLPASEQRRFLRHLRPFWDIHRHRMAPPVAQALAVMQSSGALEVRRGRIRHVEYLANRARVTVAAPSGECETLAVQRIVYATGSPAADGPDPLIGSLCGSGVAELDPNGLGVRVDEALRVVTGDGIPNPFMWALGPIVRGTFWESTAVPDIRGQALRIADAVAARIIHLEH